MTGDERRRERGERPGSGGPRATSPVVGVVVLVGVTLVLAAGVGAFVAFGEATVARPPQVQVSASLDATDGWPDGQRLRLVHEAGDSLRVADLALVVALPGPERRVRLTGFPTRRLAGEHVRGDDVVDNGVAGVDGALDAVHTDGSWESGEPASVRIAQGDLDVEAGDRAAVRLVHRPTNAVLVRTTVRAVR